MISRSSSRELCLWLVHKTGQRNTNPTWLWGTTHTKAPQGQLSLNAPHTSVLSTSPAHFRLLCHPCAPKQPHGDMRGYFRASSSLKKNPKAFPGKTPVPQGGKSVFLNHAVPFLSPLSQRDIWGAAPPSKGLSTSFCSSSMGRKANP